MAQESKKNSTQEAALAGQRGDSYRRMMSAVVSTELPPTAQKILVAAQRVLARDGYEGLTLRRVAEEALETESLLLYHFGNRANLEALLIDSLWHDIDTRFVDGLLRLPKDTDVRVDALVRFHEGIAADLHTYRMYFSLLPSVAGNKDVRRNLARIYDAYRQDINVRCLEETELPPSEVLPLAAIFLAAGEGLPLQNLVSAADFDPGPAFSALGSLTKQRAGNVHGVDAATSEVGPGSGDGVSWPSTPNPAAGLATPARKILKASQRLLETTGLPSITLDAVAAKSGEVRSAVSYYFHSKQGLIDALFASTLSRYLRAWEGMFKLCSAESLLCRMPTPNEIRRQMVGTTSPFRGLFFMLPAVLHENELRRRAGETYGSLRNTLAAHMALVGKSPACERLTVEDYAPLASLFIASVDGLAIQTLYDPAGFDPLTSLEVLSTLIETGLKDPTAHVGLAEVRGPSSTD